MKRIKPLQSLSMEHHQSLRLAKKCKDILAQTPEEIKIFSQQLQSNFNEQWLKHFKIEEESIFSVARKKGGEIASVCQQLEQEHHTMKNLVEKIAAGEYSLLQQFGQLLHDHTRREERELFPMVEAEFTDDELDNILKFGNNNS
ncbi:MAG TPA: hemerythrin domain-containing protein [Aeromonadales bacterium]|nr:hemerythrin domain-containing protein [Aeromonadales bacterium]